MVDVLLVFFWHFGSFKALSVVLISTLVCVGRVLSLAAIAEIVLLAHTIIAHHTRSIDAAFSCDTLLALIAGPATLTRAFVGRQTKAVLTLASWTDGSETIVASPAG